MSTRRVILLVLATLVIFAAGVVTGGLLVRQTTATAPAAPPPPLFPGRFDALRRATEQLNDITPAQRARINQIFRDGQERMSDFFLLFEPDILEVFRKLREDIRSELNPAQRQRMEDWLRSRTHRMEGRRGNGGLRPPEGEPPVDGRPRRDP